MPTIQELRANAKSLGIPISRTDTAATLEQKLFAAAHAPITKPKTVEGTKQAKVTVYSVATADDIRNAVQAYINKGMEVHIDETEQTWHFRFKGAEDSGHLSVPLTVIRMKAETVAKGARKPVMKDGVLYG